MLHNFLLFPVFYVILDLESRHWDFLDPLNFFFLPAWRGWQLVFLLNFIG